MPDMSPAPERYDPNGIFAGHFPVEGRTVTIAESASLAAGAVLGRITASGLYVLSASGASNGSQAPVAVLAEAADASAGAVEALAYFSGSFVSNELLFGVGHTAASVETAWRAQQAPMFIKSRSAR